MYSLDTNYMKRLAYDGCSKCVYKESCIQVFWWTPVLVYNDAEMRVWEPSDLPAIVRSQDILNLTGSGDESREGSQNPYGEITGSGKGKWPYWLEGLK